MREKIILLLFVIVVAIPVRGIVPFYSATFHDSSVQIKQIVTYNSTLQGTANCSIIISPPEGWNLINATVKASYKRQLPVMVTPGNNTIYIHRDNYPFGFAYKLRARNEYLTNVTVMVSPCEPFPPRDVIFNFTMKIWSKRGNATGDLIATAWMVVLLHDQDFKNITWTFNVYLSSYITEDSTFYFLIYSNETEYGMDFMGTTVDCQNFWPVKYNGTHILPSNARIYTELYLAPGIHNNLPYPDEVNFIINGSIPEYEVVNDTYVEMDIIVYDTTVLLFNVSWYDKFAINVTITFYIFQYTTATITTQELDGKKYYTLFWDFTYTLYGDALFIYSGPPGAAIINMTLNNTEINYTCWKENYTHIIMSQGFLAGSYKINMYVIKANYSINGPKIAATDREIEITLNYTTSDGASLLARIFSNVSVAVSFYNNTNIIRVRTPSYTGEFYIWLYFEYEGDIPYEGGETVVKVKIVSPLDIWFKVEARNASVGETTIVSVSLLDKNGVLDGEYNLTLYTYFRDGKIFTDSVEIRGMHYSFPVEMKEDIIKIIITLSYPGDIIHRKAITNITLVPQKRFLNINVKYSLSWNILVISIHINDEKTVPYTGTIYVKIRGAGYTHSITVQPRGEDIQVELYIPPVTEVNIEVTAEGDSYYLSAKKNIHIITSFYYLYIALTGIIIVAIAIAMLYAKKKIFKKIGSKTFSDILYLEFIDATIGTPFFEYCKYDGIAWGEIADVLESQCDRVIKRAAHDAVEIRAIIKPSAKISKINKLAEVTSRFVGNEIRTTHGLSRETKKAVRASIMAVFGISATDLEPKRIDTEIKNELITAISQLAMDQSEENCNKVLDILRVL